MEITKEMIEKARDYVTNAEKQKWVDTTATKCFDQLSIKLGEETLPTMYMVNASIKSRYLMTALISLYFGEKFKGDETDEGLMCEEDYDKWAGSHIVCQIDRWKRDADIRDKCFDLLHDYHELEKRLSSQITGILTVQNDMVVRQSQYSADMMKQLPAMLKELKDLAEHQQLGKDDGDDAESPAK